MSTKLAEEQVFIRKKMPLIYLVEKQNFTGVEKIIESHSGLFYVMVVIIIFLSFGLVLNIGLKIQSLNLEKKIIELNEAISIEKDRTDRIELKISELKSPNRVIKIAQDDLGMSFSDKIMVMKINENLNTADLKNLNTKTYANESIAAYLNNNKIENNEIDNKKDNFDNDNDKKIYDNFIGTISNIKDIVMVVSEGVLTFFIP